MICLESAARRGPLHPHAVNAADAAMPLQGGRLAGELQLWQPGHRGCQGFFELGPCEYLAEAAMDAKTKDQVTAWMIGPPDVEAVGVDVLARIAHCGQGGQSQDAVARHQVPIDLDVLERKAGERSHHGLIAQRLRYGP